MDVGNHRPGLFSASAESAGIQAKGPEAGTTCQILSPAEGRVWVIQGRKKSRPPPSLPILELHASSSGHVSILLPERTYLGPNRPLPQIPPTSLNLHTVSPGQQAAVLLYSQGLEGTESPSAQHPAQACQYGPGVRVWGSSATPGRHPHQGIWGAEELLECSRAVKGTHRDWSMEGFSSGRPSGFVRLLESLGNLPFYL